MKIIRGRRYDSIHTKMIIESMDAEHHKNLSRKEKEAREAAKLTPAYIRDEKMRALLQHNSNFQRNHKKEDPTIEEYEEELSYLATNILPLIEADLQGKEETFENMQEIMTYYRINFKFIAEYNAIVCKAKPENKIVEDLFLSLIKINSYFLCVAPLRCFLTEGLPIDKLGEDIIKKYIAPRVEKSNLSKSKKFIENYGKYFNFTHGV